MKTEKEEMIIICAFCNNEAVMKKRMKDKVLDVCLDCFLAYTGN